MNELLPPDSFDKSKVYFSPSGEQVAIFIENKWMIYIRNDVIDQHIQEAINLYNENRNTLLKGD